MSEDTVQKILVHNYQACTGLENFIAKGLLTTEESPEALRTIYYVIEEMLSLTLGELLPLSVGDLLVEYM